VALIDDPAEVLKTEHNAPALKPLFEAISIAIFGIDVRQAITGPTTSAAAPSL